MKVAVSGGFDPLHVGHLRMMKAASYMGDLYVLLNKDNFLKNKKGFVFMPFEERKEIIQSYSFVKKVVPVIDTDNTVAKTLAKVKPDIFCNGGDRSDNSIPVPESEKIICKKYGIEMAYGIGGPGTESSTDMIRRAYESLSKKLSKLRK